MPAIFSTNSSYEDDSKSLRSSFTEDCSSFIISRSRRPSPVTIPYVASPNPFHTLDLYLPGAGLTPNTKWLIFLHGGYWQDASQSKDVGASILTRLPPNWAGASIDYRLSPEILHPDHLLDVGKAVDFLRSAYGLESAVILAHGAGACLAFQFLAARLSLGETWIKHVVGSGGVYDLLDLSRTSPFYRAYIHDAFGSDAENWNDISPAQCEWRAVYTKDIKITLIHSKHDRLVPLEQALKFDDILTQAGFEVSLRLINLDGHDDVLETSDLIKIALEVCEDLDQHDEDNQPNYLSR